MGLQTKSVLITGCSSGFGRDTAKLLKENGWCVYVTVRKKADSEILTKEGSKVFLLDLNSSDSIKKAVQDILKASKGTLTALVNNAGSTQIGAMEDLPREVLISQFETNVFGPLELTRYLMPVFRTQGYGRIVFVTSSDNNNFAFPFLGAEASSKNALATACNALRRELRGSRISISTVCPGAFNTPIIKKSLKKFSEMNISQSAHKETYKKLIEYLKDSAEKFSDTRTILVAKAVLKILESRNPPRHVVVPFGTKLHYLAHRYLPESMQDLLLYLKMHFAYKII